MLLAWNSKIVSSTQATKEVKNIKATILVAFDLCFH